MAGFFRKAWWFFGAVAISLIIQSFTVCQEVRGWLVASGVICLVITIPLILKDYKETKIQSLKNTIEFNVHSGFRGSLEETEELERLEQMTIWTMVISWFKKRKST